MFFPPHAAAAAAAAASQKPETRNQEIFWLPVFPEFAHLLSWAQLDRAPMTVSFGKCTRNVSFVKHETKANI